MSFDADAIVIGTGPSGVSVAFPMLKAGMRVLLLDGGRERDSDMLPRGAYHDIRRHDPEQWRMFLGPRYEALRSGGPPSPKFDSPGSRFAYEGFSASQRIDGRGFTVVGSLARGGLSTIWGAGVSVYDEHDLADFPLSVSDLADSYRAVAKRIGVAGFGEDDLATPLDSTIPSEPPIPLAENARRLLERYGRGRWPQRLGLRLGRARMAVLAARRGERLECNACNLCLWGCARHAIYDASHDLPRLAAFETLDYRPGHLAHEIRNGPGAYRVGVRAPNGEYSSLSAPILIMAASTFATTRLLLAWQGRYGERLPLVTSPTVGFALLLPERIGAALPTHEFSMAHLAFSGEGPGRTSGDTAFGSLFPASGLPASLVIERIPFSRPSSIALYRYLQPALLLGNAFLPGRYSRNTVELQLKQGEAHLVVVAGDSPDIGARLAHLRRQVAGSFAALGAMLLPGSFTLVTPGEGLRYAGTFPMRARPAPGEVDTNCELSGSPGLFLVDLSVFPTIPAKHASLTLMANADRVGRRIAERWLSNRKPGGSREARGSGSGGPN
jgi:choline dehydrogenase-like flavoprotein